ncbi:hypothetical protein vseg_008276 [Gypsophila vaccaria]
MATKILKNLLTKSKTLHHHHHHHHHHHNYNLQINRSIYATCQLNGWMDSIKGVFSGTKSTTTPSHDSSKASEDSFTLLRFANELGTARKLGTLKKFVVGRGSEATFADAFEKQEAILRYLGKFNPYGENLQASQKQETAKQLKCTVADVENTLAKYTWAKEAQKKLQKLKDEGKPIPKTMAEVQKLMGSTPMDVARNSMAQSGSISRNAFCPCGSKKRYKRCCGQDK